MIIVSNTSPLTNLAAIGQFDLLQKLYSQIHIPDGVWEELNKRGEKWPGSKEVADANWIHQHTVKNNLWVSSLRRDLDKGESESIVLASELEADMILLDEKEGRRAATRINLKPVGVIGLLLEAKTKNCIKTIKPHLDSLRQIAGFRISAPLYIHALDLANEKR
jgi:uncharacterized protein